MYRRLCQSVLSLTHWHGRHHRPDDAAGPERRSGGRSAVAGMIAVAVAVVALAGCEAGGPPGTPGSVNAYVHGSVTTGISVTGH